MKSIKFGTDGWRAIIAKEYTTDNVARVAVATANWLKTKYPNPSLVIGYDCRFGGKMFAETAVKVFLKAGVKVYLSNDFASTPMVSLGVKKLQANIGVVITASHNPPEYNGYKLKGAYGGPMLSEQVDEIEAIIPSEHGLNLDNIKLDSFPDLLVYSDLEGMYEEHVRASFDLDLIKKSGLNFAFDAMYGAGRSIMRKLLPDITFLHTDENPGFEGVAPEPILRNLTELSEVIKLSENIDCAIAVDGDADRIGVFDSQGNFIDAHHVILLLIKYLKEVKNFDGEVITAFSCTGKVEQLCKVLGLKSTTTKIGFKYVCEHLISKDFLLGGEESGGMAIKGHIPERDGVWIGLTIWEYMAKSGCTIEELIQEIYDQVGQFSFERIDLHLEESQKKIAMERCSNPNLNNLGGKNIVKIEDMDGYKFHFEGGGWLMVRPSGTEPVLRTYCEDVSSESAIQTLKRAHADLLA